MIEVRDDGGGDMSSERYHTEASGMDAGRGTCFPESAHVSLRLDIPRMDRQPCCWRKVLHSPPGS